MDSDSSAPNASLLKSDLQREHLVLANSTPAESHVDGASGRNDMPHVLGALPAHIADGSLVPALTTLSLEGSDSAKGTELAPSLPDTASTESVATLLGPTPRLLLLPQGSAAVVRDLHADDERIAFVYEIPAPVAEPLPLELLPITRPIPHDSDSEDSAGKRSMYRDRGFGDNYAEGEGPSSDEDEEIEEEQAVMSIRQRRAARKAAVAARSTTPLVAADLPAGVPAPRAFPALLEPHRRSPPHRHDIPSVGGAQAAFPFEPAAPVCMPGPVPLELMAYVRPMPLVSDSEDSAGRHSMYRDRGFGDDSAEGESGSSNEDEGRQAAQLLMALPALRYEDVRVGPARRESGSSDEEEHTKPVPRIPRAIPAPKAPIALGSRSSSDIDTSDGSRSNGSRKGKPLGRQPVPRGARLRSISRSRSFSASSSDDEDDSSSSSSDEDASSSGSCTSDAGDELESSSSSSSGEEDADMAADLLLGGDSSASADTGPQWRALMRSSSDSSSDSEASSPRVSPPVQVWMKPEGHSSDSDASSPRMMLVHKKPPPKGKPAKKEKAVAKKASPKAPAAKKSVAVGAPKKPAAKEPAAKRPAPKKSVGVAAPKKAVSASKKAPKAVERREKEGDESSNMSCGDLPGDVEMASDA
jgi:hypothetical protein